MVNAFLPFSIPSKKHDEVKVINNDQFVSRLGRMNPANPARTGHSVKEISWPFWTPEQGLNYLMAFWFSWFFIFLILAFGLIHRF